MESFGRGARLRVGGRQVGPDVFEQAVRTAEWSATPVDLTGRSVEQALAIFCAAARHGGTVSTGALPTAAASTPAGSTAAGSTTAGSADAEDGPLPDGVFLAAITSGSTGTPRVVLRTLASWVDSFPDFTAATGLTADDSVLLTGPLSSTLQLFAAAHALWLGATVTDDPAVATAAHLVPTTLLEFAAQPPPRLRLAIVAGAVLPEVTASFDVVEYYGAAELSLVAFRRVPGRFRPFPGVELRTVDGLLEVRSPYLALGPTDDGWRGVGDRAEWDGHTLTVLGRGEDALSVGGHTVLCADVERQLRELPGVVDVVVVGLPHDRFGQVPAAAVVTTSSLDELRVAARQRLAGPALPRRWLRLDRLPRLFGGKVDRQAVLAALTGP